MEPRSSNDAARNPREGSEAWAAWSEWDGEKQVLIRIARQLGEAIGSDAAIEMRIDGSIESFTSPDRLSSDAPDRYFTTFDWLRMTASSSDAQAEASFVRTREKDKRYEGVTLHVRSEVFAGARGAASLRDGLVPVIDRGKTLTGFLQVGEGSTAECLEASRSLASRRASWILAIVAALTFGLEVLSAQSHRFESHLPSWGQQAAELVLWCGCHHRVIFAILWLVALVAAIVCAGVLFPAVYVGNRGRIRRTVLRVAGAAGATQLILVHSVHSAYFHVFS